MTAREAKPITAWALWRRNLLIWLSLMGLLALSLILAFIPMGYLTPASGILIGAIKAALVVFMFMELSSAKALVRLAAMTGLVFLAVMFALTLAEVLTRLA